MAKCNSGTSSGISSGTSSKNLSRVMILVLHPYSICLGFRYSRAGCDFNVINFKLCLWKSSTLLQVCHWGFSFFQNGHPLICFFWKYQNASWWCCFNAWLSFWPGIAFGGVPLRFDSKLTGRTFPYSDSGHSEMQARNMIQSLQRLRESLPLSCKCAIGILFFLRMDTLYFVSFGNTRTQARDAVSMLG